MSNRQAGPFGVTLVTQYFRPESGAAQVRLGSIVDDLAQRGHPVEVITSLPNYPLGRIFAGWSHRPLQVERGDHITVRRVWVWASMGSGLGRILNYLTFALISIPALLSAPRTEYLIVEYPTLFSALPAVAIGRLRRQRVVIIVADLWVDSITEIGVFSAGAVSRLLGRCERWTFKRAHVVTAVTEGVRDALIAKGVPEDRLAWLPNGADTDMFAPGDETPRLREDLNLGDGESMILYAGTHGYVHGLEVVLDAAGLLRDVPVRFVLVGSGSEKPALQAEASRRGLDNVTFLDPVQPRVVADMLRSSIAGLATVRAGDVYRSIRSAKMLPTMASGRPVIYSGDDEGSRIVDKVGAGLVTEPGDGAALADAVRELLNSPERREKLGLAGRRWVEDNASWHRLVGDWLDQVQKVS